MIEEIVATLEVQLGCILVVAHVPSTAMITKGTDSLSRGVCISPYQHSVSARALTISVFAPIENNPDLMEFVLHRYGLSFSPWTVCA